MVNLRRKIKTASQIWIDHGWQGVKSRIKNITFEIGQKIAYQKWVREFDTLTNDDRQLIRQQIEKFSHQPLISIILPVYNVDEKWLRLCLDSVRRQIYQNWELCIADDCSPKPHIRQVLEEYQNEDSRIKVVFREKNGHISAASNSALEIATGEFSVLLDHDDELSEHALYFVANELNRFPETQMIYSDEDLIDEKGERSEPKFKPDWSQDLIYSLNLITHLSAYRTELLKKISGFTIGAEGSQDYDLALRVSEEIDEKQIRHIPHILYHWRAISGSVALNPDEKPYAHERAREAIRRHFERVGIKAKVSEGYFNLHRVIYDSEPSFEIIKLKDATAESLNILAGNSLSDVLIFVDASLEIVSNESFSELAKIAVQKNIGAVGGKFLTKNATVRNGGVILGVDKLLGFAHQGISKLAPGSFVRSQVVGNFSAISGVVAIRRDLFQEMNGFDAKNFNEGLFEIDLCLRLREKGLRIVFTPHAEFIQKGKCVVEKALQNIDSAEFARFKEKWKRRLERDEFYNENLSLKNAKFAIELPPRIKKPWKN
ncbi:MAG TPA: glycosyltransferase [Pyrinomonadaceae bacterium]|nr:glycosyltransferase [Pyrinomonadaceae bacterium]